jgi:hypothetical protein
MELCESAEGKRGTVGRPGRGVFHLCVGESSSPLSAVWKIHVRGDDIYIFSSRLGSDLKVSIHASGSAHWSVNARWFLQRGLEFRNQDRHVVRWNRKNPEPTRAAHIFRIILPGSELRPHSSIPSTKTVSWLPQPPPNAAWEIEIYLTPPRQEAPSTAKSPYQQLALLKTESKKWLAILAHQEVVTPEKRRTLIAARRNSRGLIAQSSLRVGEFPAIGFLQSPDNPPGLIELVLRQGLLRSLVQQIKRWRVVGVVIGVASCNPALGPSTSIWRDSGAIRQRRASVLTSRGLLESLKIITERSAWLTRHTIKVY